MKSRINSGVYIHETDRITTASMDTNLCTFHSHLLKHQEINRASQRVSYTAHLKTLTKLITICLVLVSLPDTCHSQCTGERGCFPPVGNLSVGRPVNTSSTCLNGMEYCIFLENECMPCMPDTVNSPASINDNDESTVWVSRIGTEHPSAVLQFDFEAPFLFEGTTLVFDSIRPSSMILERSSDYGVTWDVYRYYSTGCLSMFFLPDTFIAEDTVLDSLNAVCTSSESLLFPFRGGRVTFATTQHLSPNASQEEVMQFRTVTNIRVQLLDFFEEISLGSSSFAYYSISEWYVMGLCLCNGHADMCTPLPGDLIAPNKVYSGCVCQHNTVGERCDQCVTGFNNAPWAPGTPTEASVCQACICNEHAMDCEYTPALSSAICTNCSDNTSGNQCQECSPGFFQDMSLLLNDVNVCQACECSTLGTADDSMCDGQGQCTCKRNIDPTSLKCSECLDGFWNLTGSNPDGCQVCDCEPDGTQQVSGRPLCDKQTGQCVCQSGAEGDRCDQCTPGFYRLSGACLACNCNLGGSESPVCDQTSTLAQCPCKPNIGSITCSSPLPNFFFKALDSIVYEAEEGLTQGIPQVFPLEGMTGPFTGRGFVAPLPHSDINIAFIFSVPQDNQYEIIIRYETPATVDGVGFTLYSRDGVNLDLNCDSILVPVNVSRFHISSLPTDQRYLTIFSVCLNSSVEYQLLLEYNSFSPVAWLLDSLVLLPAFSEISAYYESQSTPNQVDIIEPCLPRAASSQVDILCEETFFSLSTEFFGAVFACSCHPDGSVDNDTCSPSGGSCAPCFPGVTGSSCDGCLNGWFGFGPGGCQECDCDPQGSVSPACDHESGQCSCRPGAGGRRCGECLPGQFNLTSSGCSPCECSEFARSEACDSLGQCSCPDGVGGLRCDACSPGFYNISSEGCLQCECNPFGSLSEVCESESGQCVCTGNSVGQNCNECPDSTFLTNGITRDRCVECVCSGMSNSCVVDDASHVLGEIRSDFGMLCSASPTNCSDGWQLLTFNGQEAAPYGPSDSYGLGYILLLNHDPMLYAPDHFLGNRLGSYGFSFNVVVLVRQTFGNGMLQVEDNIVRMVSSRTGDILVGVFPFPEIMNNGFDLDRVISFSIILMEGHWRIGGIDGATPTQTQFLSVLSDVGEFSFSAEFTDDIIEFIQVSNISLLSTFLTTELADPPLISPFPVENCTCPNGYAGSSCQNCARGFARPSGIIADTCMSCECNSLSLDCDVSTGVCLNCGGNSEGLNCERCRSGYYGDPTRGVPCQQCACPLVANSFSPTCFLDDSDDVQTCDSCAPGYTGRNCETCMEGYYGNPLLGGCNTCECNRNVDPSSGPVCNITSGQCMNCLNNTVGFECELCAAGYFGDPTLTSVDMATGEPVWANPCQACECDPRGTVGDCDTLFGTCACQPNVIGPLCDECEDGYWGLSQGLGCIPCDCCSNGSTNGVCDKESGTCDCLPNVGSGVDNKCCTCTPGYFNFSSSEGCDACNCSPLAMTNECDLLTGRCQCEEGAIGLKCDDCAFGFTGQVPNCERCHECYFQWYDNTSEVASRVSDLLTRIQSLITTYYNNHTVESIQTEIDLLLGQLENATLVINSIMLNEGDINELELIIVQLTTSMDDYVNRILAIQQAIDEAEVILINANMFDGTVNMSDVLNVEMLIEYYNSTIFMITQRTNDTIDMLRQVQENAYSRWIQLNDIEAVFDLLVGNLTSNEETLSNTGSRLMELIQSNYTSLRANLSFLDAQANLLDIRLVGLSRGLLNISISLQESNLSIFNLIEEIERREAQVEVALNLARDLNETVRRAFATALEVNGTVHALAERSESTLEEANVTLTGVLESLQSIPDIRSILNMSKSAAVDILGLSGPSVQSAVQLSENINRTILSDELVAEIIRNASRGLRIAEEALSEIMEASSTLVNASTLIDGLKADLNCTRGLHQELETGLVSVTEDIGFTESNLNQINELSNELRAVISETDEVSGSVEGGVESANQDMADDLNTLNTLLEDANQIANESQLHRERVEGAIDTYSTSLEQQAVNTRNEANRTLTLVESLNQQARNTSAVARVVSQEELQDLLEMYRQQTLELNSLSSQVSSLQQELGQLTESLSSAANRLQNCYKTP